MNRNYLSVFISKILYLFNPYSYQIMNKTINEITSNTNAYQPSETLKWGFTQFSEKINGRIAMISFVLLFIIELITKQNLGDLLKLINFY